LPEEVRKEIHWHCFDMDLTKTFHKSMGNLKEVACSGSRRNKENETSKNSKCKQKLHDIYNKNVWKNLR